MKAAGLRWTIEENFQASKGLAGLDDHQVRTWTSWHRWVTLAMLASAFLAIAAAAERARNPGPPGQIPLTRNEIACLLASLIIKPADEQPAPAVLVQSGAGATSTEPRPAITSGEPGTYEDHDLRLEY